MNEQEKNDLKTLISALRVAQSRGSFKLEQSEVIAKCVRNVQNYIEK